MVSATPVGYQHRHGNRDSTSSLSISREINAPRTAGGTTMFQASAVLQSSDASGSAVQAPQEAPDGGDVRGRSGRAGLAARCSRKPGPMLSNVGGFIITAAPTKSTPAIRSSPYAPEVVGDDEPAVGPRDQHRPVQTQLIDDRGKVVRPQLRRRV